MICSRIINCFSELIGDIAEDRHDPADPAEIIRYIRQDDDQIGMFPIDDSGVVGRVAVLSAVKAGSCDPSGFGLGSVFFPEDAVQDRQIGTGIEASDRLSERAAVEENVVLQPELRKLAGADVRIGMGRKAGADACLFAPLLHAVFPIPVDETHIIFVAGPADRGGHIPVRSADGGRLGGGQTGDKRTFHGTG